MSSFKERYLKLEYIPSRRVKRYDCVSVAMMWSLALFTFLLIVPTEDKPAVGIRNGDVFMNWTIHDTSLIEPRFISGPKNEHMVYFRIGATTYTNYLGNFSQRITDVGDVSQGVVSFRLSKLTEEDAGRYTFQLQGSFDIGGQVLIIAVPPKQPVVTEFMPAVEGTDYRLSCSASSNSKPSNHGLPMISEWKVRGQSIVTGGRYTIIGTELTIARLTFQDNGATVSCSVYEDQRAKSDESTVWTIDIKYGPTNVLLTSSNLSNVSETSSVSINCTADCNPPCNFLWRRGSSVNSVSTTQTLYIEAASKYDADNYTCFVSNYITMMTRTISTMIIVNYGPASDQMTLIPPERLITVVEDTIMSINCSTDCYPICKYEWTGPLNLLVQSSTLSLLIDRNKGGTYTCTAKNEQNQRKTATANVTVTVYYGPESSISIGSIPPLYNVNLTEKVADIICNASCNPPCNFSWYKDTTLLSNNKTLSLGIIKKSDRGNYTCHASNIFLTMQRSYSKSFYMIINFGAEIKHFSVHQGREVNENGSATFLCSVDSYPNSKITLKRQSHESILKSELDALQSEYQIQSANCLDTDNYTCTADNGVEQPVVTTLEFFVKCHPRTDFRFHLVNITYSKRHGDAILKYSVISYPPPTFTWSFIGNGSEHKDIPSAATQYSNGQQSELRFKNLEWGDFGLYRVSAENNVGSPAMVVLELVSAEQWVESTTGLLIPGVAGGLGAVCAVILVAVVAVILWRRYQVKKKSCDGLVDNPVYDSSELRSSSPSCSGTEYAVVKKSKKKAAYVGDPGNLYAQVEKSPKKGKKGKKGDIYENATTIGKSSYPDSVSQNSKNVPTEVSSDIYENPNGATSHGSVVNNDGLLYADLKLEPPTTINGQPLIRGLEDRTEYADIAYGKRGEPLSDTDEEKGKGNTNKQRRMEEE